MWESIQDNWEDMKGQWKSTDPTKQQKALTPSEVTLYDLMEHYIMPKTREDQCSFVELAASDALCHYDANKSTKWFVSHWWGEPVEDFLRCLEAHQRHHRVSHCVYWVCAYALNQHFRTNEIGRGDPKDSPFYRALKSSVGTVSVVDEECICFSRIWCSYEVWLTVDRQGDGFQYELYTSYSKRELARVTWGDGDTHFPLHFLPKVMEMGVGKSASSLADDRKRILNSIAGNSDLLVDPPKTHPAYASVDCALRGRLALAMFRNAVARGDELHLYRQAIVYSGLCQINFRFDGKTFNQKPRAVGALVDALPSSLVSLDLKSTDSDFVSARQLVGGIGNLSRLESLSIDWSDNTALTDVEALWGQVTMLPFLRRLQLNFSGTGIPSFSNGFVKALSSMPSLLEIDINLNECGSFKSASKLAEALSLCPGLRSLNLSIGATGVAGHFVGEKNLKRRRGDFLTGIIDEDTCKQLGCLPHLFAVISHMSALQSLALQLWTFFGIDFLADLTTAVGRLKGLRTLILELPSLSCSRKPSSKYNRSTALQLRTPWHDSKLSAGLWTSISELKQLERLEVLCCDNGAIESLDDLGSSIGQMLVSLPVLQRLLLGFGGCRKLRQLPDLAYGLDFCLRRRRHRAGEPLPSNEMFDLNLNFAHCMLCDKEVLLIVHAIACNSSCVKDFSVQFQGQSNRSDVYTSPPDLSNSIGWITSLEKIRVIAAQRPLDPALFKIKGFFRGRSW